MQALVLGHRARPGRRRSRSAGRTGAAGRGWPGSGSRAARAAPRRSAARTSIAGMTTNVAQSSGMPSLKSSLGRTRGGSSRVSRWLTSPTASSLSRQAGRRARAISSQAQRPVAPAASRQQPGASSAASEQADRAEVDRVRGCAEGPVEQPLARRRAGSRTAALERRPAPAVDRGSSRRARAPGPASRPARGQLDGTCATTSSSSASEPRAIRSTALPVAVAGGEVLQRVDARRGRRGGSSRPGCAARRRRSSRSPRAAGG